MFHPTLLRLPIPLFLLLLLLLSLSPSIPALTTSPSTSTTNTNTISTRPSRLLPRHGGGDDTAGPVDNCTTMQGSPLDSFECTRAGWDCRYPTDDEKRDGRRDGAVMCDDTPWPVSGCWCDPGTCCFVTPDRVAYCTKDVCGIEGEVEGGGEGV